MTNRHARSVLIAGVSLAVVAGLGFAWASGATAADNRFVTAVATNGDVSESYLATGTVSRENVVEAAFPGAGTVQRVRVAVGDQVAAGDVLATLDTAALKLSLLNAQTDLARARANLYAAEHPTSGSSGTVKLPTGLPGGGSSNPGGSVPGGISATDAATLYRAIAAVNVATAKWSNPQTPTTCDLVYAALLRANEQEPTPEPTQEPTAEPTAEPSSEPTTQPTSEPTTEPTGQPGPEPTADPEPTPSPSAEPGPSPSAEPTAAPSGEAEPLALVVDDITVGDITACGQARTDLFMANAVLADYYQQLLTTGTIVTDDGPGTPGGTPGGVTIPGGSSGLTGTPRSTSATPKVSARAVAAAQAEVLRAQQAVDAAERAVSDAELTAPIAGTVGALSLAVGESATGGAVTIVGAGTAVVSIEVPLASRSLLSQGMAAVVTPAGSLDSLPGAVGRISLLETDGTAGDSPTYTTTILVEDAGMLLKTGAPAGVEIITRTANGVVTVPVSAVTPTGAGTATVQVVEHVAADTAQTVTVSTGAVGGGRVEITDGLASGQLVVLSDRTAALPAGNFAQMRRTMGGR